MVRSCSACMARVEKGKRGAGSGVGRVRCNGGVRCCGVLCWTGAEGVYCRTNTFAMVHHGPANRSVASTPRVHAYAHLLPSTRRGTCRPGGCTTRPHVPPLSLPVYPLTVCVLVPPSFVDIHTRRDHRPPRCVPCAHPHVRCVCSRSLCLQKHRAVQRAAM